MRPQKARGPLPVIMWFHGGGQVLGFAAQDAPWLKRLCAALGCAVAAVDYRLAPETPAPGAAEDGYTAYRWISDNASDLGLDPTRVGLAGQSGGGGIAAATALLVRDRGAATPLFQLLMYAMLDDRGTTDSSREITDIGIWDRSTNLLAWQAFLGDRADLDCAARLRRPRRAAPLPRRLPRLRPVRPAVPPRGELPPHLDELPRPAPHEGPGNGDCSVTRRSDGGLLSGIPPARRSARPTASAGSSACSAGCSGRRSRPGFSSSPRFMYAG
ncbi:alpha/beta hydrolase fold domain-containing protein [Nonomuraea sp. NPDC049649]|uniref:alpha/beta hydrolase fold domain-containing protein n=1 Tax=Nonomuraea sp. NPDC049649 TaxID=3155776 RepID=UPI00342023F9